MLRKRGSNKGSIASAVGMSVRAQLRMNHVVSVGSENTYWASRPAPRDGIRFC